MINRATIRAFTLFEMVLSLSVLAILLLAVQSTALLVDRASPKEGSATSATLSATRTLDQIASELTFATSVTRAAANDLEFTVPDRNGDGLPETIRYTWSDKVGDSLVRTFNGVNPSNVAKTVQEFRFAYDTRTVQLGPGSSEGPETLLVSYDPLLTLLTGANFRVNSTSWIGAYFRPSLPSNATRWRITRVLLEARQRDAAAGKTFVQIRPAYGNLPGAEIIDQATMLESALGNGYAWQTFSFDKAAGLTPGSGICLVLQWSSDTDACEVFYNTSILGLPGQSMISTTNGGASWSSSGDRQMAYYVYGKVSTPTTAGTRDLLTSVRCTLRTSDDPKACAQASVTLLNEPPAPAPGGVANP